MDGPLSVHDLIDRVWLRLGRNPIGYPAEEVVANGLNPAQRLLTLLTPDVLTQRVAVTLVAQDAWFDLRQWLPRALVPQRVVLGDVTNEDRIPSLGDVRALTLIQRAVLRVRRRDWWQHTGTPRHWYRHGQHLVGIYPRPMVACVVTCIAQALPRPLAMDTVAAQEASSDLPVLFHPLIADVAACLLLMKEGQVEVERALHQLADLLGDEAVTPMQQALVRVPKVPA